MRGYYYRKHVEKYVGKEMFFGMSPGTMTQLDTSRVMSADDVRLAKKAWRRQVAHDLRDMTEGGVYQRF
jgi:hypothetical protein